MSRAKLILHNFWLKVFSFVLAVMIWVAIHSNLQHTEQPERKTRSAPEHGVFVRRSMSKHRPEKRRPATGPHAGQGPPSPNVVRLSF